MIRDDQLQLIALCALEGVTGAQWSAIARQASTPTGLQELLQGVVTERSSIASTLRENLERELPHLPQAVERVTEATDRASAAGAELVTALEDAYPPNLRRIHNLPPFLYILGDLQKADVRSVAVVGTRQATERGLKQASKLARQLVEHGVTVVSGMAAGIDTSAHTATLEAGGRTVAVMGTGILRTYPKHNEELKHAIAEHGAVVSQFWPDQPPGRHTFPLRNIVSSGISQGTVVIEAAETSGAKMQARIAWEHGKRAFLVRSLVTDQPWAQTMVAERRATEVADVDDVLRWVQDPTAVIEATHLREQLALEIV